MNVRGDSGAVDQFSGEVDTEGIRAAGIPFDRYLCC